MDVLLSWRPFFNFAQSMKQVFNLFCFSPFKTCLWLIRSQIQFSFSLLRLVFDESGLKSLLCSIDENSPLFATADKLSRLYSEGNYWTKHQQRRIVEKPVQVVQVRPPVQARPPVQGRSPVRRTVNVAIPETRRYA